MVILTYLAYLMIPATLFLLYRTSLGLTLRSTGENPVAVDFAGLNVNRIRFLTVLVAGAVGVGIDGGHLMLGGGHLVVLGLAEDAQGP